MMDLREINKEIRRIKQVEQITEWTRLNPDKSRKAKANWYKNNGKEYQKNRRAKLKTL